MITLLAIMLAKSSTGPISPSYKEGHCYSVSEPEFRPGTIKVTEIKLDEYAYRVWYNEKGWGDQLQNDFDTIEIVYGKEVACP